MTDWWSTFKKKIKEPDLLTAQMGGMDIADLPADARITDSGILDANWKPYPIESRGVVERLGEVGSQMLPLAGGMIAPPTGMTLGAGPKLPKVIEGYHGTSHPTIFDKPSLPDNDLGIHFARRPIISDWYAGGADRGIEYLIDRGNAPMRTYPVVIDAKNPIKGAQDPGKWTDPEATLIAMGYQDDGRWLPNDWISPQGKIAGTKGPPISNSRLQSDLLDLNKAGTQAWTNQLIPLLESYGHDAIRYTHGDYSTPIGEAVMAFRPEQVHGRFTPEAQQLIKERGLERAVKTPPVDLMGFPDAESKKELMKMYHGMTLNKLPPYLRGRGY